MLNSEMSEALGRIAIRDFSIHAVEALLRFVYSGKLAIPLDEVVEVAALADKYAISPLEEIVKRSSSAAETA